MTDLINHVRKDLTYYVFIWPKLAWLFGVTKG